MKFKLIILLLIGVLFSSNLYSYEIGDFPEYFMEDNSINVNFVLGSNAHAKDVITAVDIATKVQYLQDSLQLRNLGSIGYLDNEIDDVSKRNNIVIGGPCINSAAAELLDFPIDCRADMSPGDSIIKLYEFDNSHSLLIAGYHADDTRRAGSVIANHEDYNLTGRTLEVFEQHYEDHMLI